MAYALALLDSRLLPGGCVGAQQYKGFLSKAWFSPENAGALRGYLQCFILEQFIEQVRC